MPVIIGFFLKEANTCTVIVFVILEEWKLTPAERLKNEDGVAK